MKVEELDDEKWYNNPSLDLGICAPASYWRQLLEKALDEFDMDLVACLDSGYEEYKPKKNLMFKI